jgi:hypothetical protein
LTVAANLHGVWAKWERAVEQLAALDKEGAQFCAEPYPYTIHSHADRERGRYRFEIYPAWMPGVPYRWGAIIGEIVHDLRSALDNLVCQLLAPNGERPDVGHAFPVLATEPAGGFATHTRRQSADRRGRPRHGPLFGVGDEALTIIEACQPYSRQDGLPLQRLHALWNLDKHRNLAPIHVIAAPARLHPDDAVVLGRDDRLDGRVYVVEVTVQPGTYVDVSPQPPTDVTLGQGVPVVLELKHVGQLILTRTLPLLASSSQGCSGLGCLGELTSRQLSARTVSSGSGDGASRPSHQVRGLTPARNPEPLASSAFEGGESAVPVATSRCRDVCSFLAGGARDSDGRLDRRHDRFGRPGAR